MNTREGSTNANEKPSTTCVPTRQQARTGERVREQDEARKEVTKKGLPAESAQIAFFNWQSKQRGEIMGVHIKTIEGASIATCKIYQPGDEYNHHKSITFQVPLTTLPAYVLCQLMTEQHAHEVSFFDAVEIFDNFYDKMKLIKIYIEETAAKRANLEKETNEV